MHTSSPSPVAVAPPMFAPGTTRGAVRIQRPDPSLGLAVRAPDPRTTTGLVPREA